MVYWVVLVVRLYCGVLGGISSEVVRIICFCSH